MGYTDPQDIGISEAEWKKMKIEHFDKLCSEVLEVRKHCQNITSTW